MAFALFILVNAVLFTRPTELLPALEGFPLYNGLIIGCTACALPLVARRLTLRALAFQPVTLCVLGVLVAIVMTNVMNAYESEAWQAGHAFFKVLVYYLLFVAIVTSVARLRQFLFWFVLFAAALVVVPVLDFHGVIDLSTLEALQDVDQADDSGDPTTIARLQATGIFHDPNDLSLIIVIGIFTAAYWLTERRSGSLRYLWALPLALFGHALALTHSRGGLLALVAGMCVFSQIRFGWKKTLLWAACGLPLILVFFAGRQTQLSMSEGTGQERIRIWSDGIDLFRGAPIFGIGTGRFQEQVGYVSHNSFLQGFAEIGFFGGMFFLGAFYLSAWMLYRLRPGPHAIIDPELRRLYPYLAAILAVYIVGMLSLSLTYVVPTYMVLALVAVYQRLAVVEPPLPFARFNVRLLERMALVSVTYLALIYVFVRVSVRWS